jgi:hypothetical protein
VFGLHVARAAGQVHRVLAATLYIAGEHAQQLERPRQRMGADQRFMELRVHPAPLLPVLSAARRQFEKRTPSQR